MCEEFIGWGTREGEFEDITSPNALETVRNRFKNYLQACHCMFFAYGSQLIIEQYTPKATVLMQLRFDGHFGFPGGLVYDEEPLVDGLNRELVEEIGYPTCNSDKVTSNDYSCSHVSNHKKLVTNFFIKEVTYDKIKEIEATSFTAKDYGSEVMGCVRIPLFTMNDGYRGFPAFLSNTFIGNTKVQLIKGLTDKNILTLEEINTSLSAKPAFIPMKTEHL